MNIKETLTIWFKAARAPFLVVSLLPSILGGVMAYSHHSFDWTIFILATIGIVMAHSAADFIDDYYDYINGNLGNKEQQFHDSPLIDGKVTTRQVLIAAGLCMLIAVGAGIYLLMEVGLPVLYLMAAGAFIVFFYTAPPVRLNYRGLGETALFFAFGPMIVFGMYYVLTSQFSWEPILASIPIGIFTMNVGIVSNIFDHDDDVKSGKRCIPVRFGQPATVQIIRGVTVIAFGTLLLGALLGIMPMWTLLGLLTLPLGWAVVRMSARFADTTYYTPAMTRAIALTSVMSLLLTLAYALVILF
ncbi:MAG TPA: prenyltransferase [Bacteroidales bacterium]|nr:prenyltransferase [Bacteroidales bacterium]HRZ76921.1 prenyltransferase [Bacteroidales bacterium]